MSQVDASPSGPACQVCCCRDETLRLVSYPYVVSFLIVTSRRAFSGMWCARHRRLRLVLATLITSTIGWLGIPFGIIFTPVVLWQLARGGLQPAERNKTLLKAVADDALQHGEMGRATRSLEAALDFGDDDDTCSRLSQLYLAYGAAAETESAIRQAARLGIVLFVAMLIGRLAGTIDYLVTVTLANISRRDDPVWGADR